MKTKHLRIFLEEFLARQGAETERRGDNLLTVRMPRRLAPAVGSRDLLLAFNLQGVKEDPHSELATVGNPVFDRILELARNTGRTGERFEKLTGRKASPPDPKTHFQFEGEGVKVLAPRPAYTPLYYFLYRIEHSLKEVADELEVVPIDSVTLLSLPQIPEVVEHWSALEREPEPGREVLPAYPLDERAARAALRFLERRLRKRLGRIRKDSEERLSREVDSINAYYLGLISETRHAGKRWALPASGREERIRILQLDWKRRVEEAHQVWSPHLEVSLSAVAATQRPRVGFEIARPASPRSRRTAVRSDGSPRASARLKNPSVYWDEIDKTFVDPPCLRCGTPEQTRLTPTDGGFLCPRCDHLETGA